MKYGGVIFNRRHFTVYGESINTFVSPTRLWTFIHRIICWTTKRRIRKIISAADIYETKPGDYRVQLFRRLKSLNKTLDCEVDGLFFDVDFNTNSIFIRMMINQFDNVLCDKK